MACLEMHNSNGTARISFSNEFIEIRPEKKNVVNSRNSLSKSEGSNFTLSSVDFEFSVSNYSMMPADELFFKGKILPFKETNTHVHRSLREEFLAEEEEEEEEIVDGNIFRPLPLLSSAKGRWRELLGLKKAQIGSKKSDKINVEEICSLGHDHQTISDFRKSCDERLSHCKNMKEG